MPRADDAEVVFTSIASPNANHTQGGITRIVAGRMMARGEEAGNELRLTMNGNQSARQIVIRKTANSTGHHKHKRRWGGAASRYSRLGHLPPEDQGISLSPLIAAIHRLQSTI